MPKRRTTTRRRRSTRKGGYGMPSMGSMGSMVGYDPNRRTPSMFGSMFGNTPTSSYGVPGMGHRYGGKRTKKGYKKGGSKKGHKKGGSRKKKRSKSKRSKK